MTDATLMGAKPSFVAPSQPLEKSLQELIQGRGCQLDDSELQPFCKVVSILAKFDLPTGRN